MFKRICIANRGEIAVRIARTCRRLGISTHALYSDADTGAMHVRAADSATWIGPSPVSKSYLNIEAVIQAARNAGCDAIHPGYGLLSENAAFARACIDNGLVFIGPAPEHILLMGDKHAARAAMAARGVPIIPGSLGVLDDGDVTGIAAAVGYPLMIKASRGGGGIGMAMVDDPSQLDKAITRARSTAARSFGSGELYIERKIVAARHVELQVLGDGKGGIVIVGDRECSVQRRHQKIIEEAPAPSLNNAIRATMVSQIAEGLKSISYSNAGTVECLLDQDNQMYFLEMNTRLQVEHPVTEMVSRVDLVEWQIRLAAGESLARFPSSSAQGCAIEARIYAEDPETFLPAPGPIERFSVPAGEGIRLDAGVEQGDTATPYYDPLIAKIIVHAADRPAALVRMRYVLGATELHGLTHNIPFLVRVLDEPKFQSGNYSVTLVPDLIAAGK